MIPNSIAGLENLEELNLATNPLEALPDSIGFLQNLKILDVSSNKLETLPDTICHCRSFVGSKRRKTGSDLSSELLEVTRDCIDNHKSEGNNILGRDLTDLEDNDESFECFNLPTEKFFFAFWLHLVFTILIGTCLEVIEHMEEDQALLFDDVALSYFHPKVLIISTPNYEYNVILQKSALS